MPGKPEVTDFKYLTSILFKNKYVLQFKIAMSDSFGVKIGKALSYALKGFPFDVDFRLLFSKVV
jgi:hypothetical protein